MNRHRVENNLRHLLYVAPLALAIGLVTGLTMAIVRVAGSGDWSFGLWRAMIADVNSALNAGLFTAFYLAALLYIIAAVQLLFGRSLAGAVLCSAGILLFYPLLLTFIWLTTKLLVEAQQVSLHRLPHLLRENTDFTLYLQRHWLDYLNPMGVVHAVFRHGPWLLASALPALGMGIWFERGFRRLLPGVVAWAGRQVAAPEPVADGKPGRNRWVVRSVLVVVTAGSIAILSNIVAEGSSLMRGEARPNVILVSIDTLRADRLGCYGNTQGITPAIDKLAARGVVFEEAIANAPWTLPSHGGMLTGVQPSALGLYKVTDRLSVHALTLAEVLHDDGYDTGAVVSYVLLDKVYGFHQGFDYFDYVDEQPAAQVVDKALKFLEPRTRQKFFLFLHFYDPHWQYEPPADAARKFWPRPVPADVRQFVAERDFTRFAINWIHGPDTFNEYCLAMYNGEVFEVDRQLERVLRFLVDRQMIDRTLVVITSDHGEEFREHGLVGHGLTLYDESLRVPLVMRLPLMMPEGVRIKGQVQTIDLFPTILSAVGLDPSTLALDGRDLLPLIQGGQVAPVPMLLETAMSGETRYALRDGHYKLIQPYQLDFGSELKINKPEELFDLNADPAERQNLAVTPTAECDALREVMGRRIEAVRREHAAGTGRSRSQALSPEETERLRSLGYLK